MDLDKEKEELLRRDAEWSTVVSEGSDVERMLSYWTDDAIVLPPGLPAIIGKAALRQYVEDSLQIPGFKISWTSTDATLSTDGELAYVFSRNTVTFNGPDGKLVTTEGLPLPSGVRKLINEWRCVVDIWNAEPNS